MERLVSDLKTYLYEVTGLEISAKLFNGGDLPYFLSRQYALYRLKIGKTSFIAVCLQQADEFTPAQFMKHMHQIPFIHSDEVCVIAQMLPGYVRKRLIEKRIPFVIPKVQMYLPTLGMELRPRAGDKKNRLVEHFSPATQVVLIHWLLGRMQESITPLALSKQLLYSAMTMSRALDELESTQIAQVDRVGRERLLSFPGTRKDIWDAALPRMFNPVSHIVQIFEHQLNRQDVLIAGTSALARHSMLGEPVFQEFATSRDSWKEMEKGGIKKIPVKDSGTCILQIWRYDPNVLASDEQVDPFSLYLSLRNEKDERVEIALEEMLERHLW